VESETGGKCIMVSEGMDAPASRRGSIEELRRPDALL